MYLHYIYIPVFISIYSRMHCDLECTVCRIQPIGRYSDDLLVSFVTISTAFLVCFFSWCVACCRAFQSSLLLHSSVQSMHTSQKNSFGSASAKYVKWLLKFPHNTMYYYYYVLLLYVTKLSALQEDATLQEAYKLLRKMVAETGSG